MSWLTDYGQAALTVTADGQPLQADLWPQARLLMVVSAELRRIEQHFGMSPSARAALGQVQGRQDGDEAKATDKKRFFRACRLGYLGQAAARYSRL